MLVYTFDIQNSVTQFLVFYSYISIVSQLSHIGKVLSIRSTPICVR